MFSDPHHVPRTANHISWYADGPRKLAVSYCSLEFQSVTLDSYIDSYIWDIGIQFFISYMFFIRFQISNRKSYATRSLS